MNKQFDLLRARVLSTTQAQEGWLVVDVSQYDSLVLYFRVIVAGSGGSIEVQTATYPSGDDSEWEGLVNASVPLTSAGNAQVEVRDFMRYIRWRAVSPSGSPVAEISVLAKQE